MLIETSWTSLKLLADQKNLSLQHLEEDTHYKVFLADGALIFCTRVAKGSDTSEAFEPYRVAGNRRLASASAALPSPEDFRFRATSTGWHECAQGTTNIDLVAHAFEDRWVNGGVLLVDGAARGDSATFSVVHPVSGVVETYVPSWSVLPGTNQHRIEAYPARVPAGLTLRLAYTRAQAGSAHAAVNYLLHKKGIA